MSIPQKTLFRVMVIKSIQNTLFHKYLLSAYPVQKYDSLRLHKDKSYIAALIKKMRPAFLKP